MDTTEPTLLKPVTARMGVARQINCRNPLRFEIAKSEIRLRSNFGDLQADS